MSRPQTLKYAIKKRKNSWEKLVDLFSIYTDFGGGGLLRELHYTANKKYVDIGPYQKVVFTTLLLPYLKAR